MSEDQDVTIDVSDIISHAQTIVDGKKKIIILGEIGESTAESIIPDLISTNWEQQSIDELNIYIFSEGGYLSTCFAIIDLVQSIKELYDVKIVTHAIGEIASGGFFLFLLGDERILYPNCRVFVHEHITVDEEPKTFSEKIKEDRTTEKDLYEMYLTYTATQLKCTRLKAKRLLAKNKWLTTKEIKQFNILGDDDE